LWLKGNFFNKAKWNILSIINISNGTRSTKKEHKSKRSTIEPTKGTKEKRKKKRELLTNAQTQEQTKPPTMIIKSKVNVFCLQPLVG